MKIDRIITSCVVVGILAAASPATVVGQGASSLPGADAVKALVAARTAKGFTPPKTPWGDPDIQGIFTTKDEANTPFERPDEWAGKRMEDITQKEFAEAIAKRQQEAVERAPFAGGGEEEEGVAIAVPIHWFDNLAAVNSRPWFVIDPPEGKVPALAPTAKANQAIVRGRNGGERNTYLDRSNGDRCISFAFRMPAIYGNSYQIVQTKDYVVFRREQLHDARVIPLTDKPLSGVRSYEGQSRGHWDGNTLVVETANFDERVPYRGYSARNLRVVERFTRIAPNKVEYSMTVDNPAVYSRPWTYSYPLTQDNSQLIHEYACHEGNFGLANLLSAGRAAEKKAGQ
jgi:hypothetical protein